MQGCVRWLTELLLSSRIYCQLLTFFLPLQVSLKQFLPHHSCSTISHLYCITLSCFHQPLHTFCKPIHYYSQHCSSSSIVLCSSNSTSNLILYSQLILSFFKLRTSQQSQLSLWLPMRPSALKPQKSIPYSNNDRLFNQQICP